MERGLKEVIGVQVSDTLDLKKKILKHNKFHIMSFTTWIFFFFREGWGSGRGSRVLGKPDKICSDTFRWAKTFCIFHFIGPYWIKEYMWRSLGPIELCAKVSLWNSFSYVWILEFAKAMDSIQSLYARRNPWFGGLSISPNLITIIIFKSETSWLKTPKKFLFIYFINTPKKIVMLLTSSNKNKK